MSWQARAVDTLLRATKAKRGFASADPTGERLALLEAKPQGFEPPGWLMGGVDVVRRDVGDVPVYEISPSRFTRHVFYCHGGAYINRINPIHWRWLRHLAREGQVRIEVPMYPLAPGSTAAQTVPLVTDLLQDLIRRVGASNVTLAGDSAGGGLALSVAQELLRRGSQPAQIVLNAPWLDASCTDPEQVELDAHDLILSPPGLAECGRAWAGHLDLKDPIASPLFGELKGLAPLYVWVGTHDILCADSRRLAERCVEVGTPMTLIEGDGMQHVYPLLPIPEGKQARAAIAELVR